MRTRVLIVWTLLAVSSAVFCQDVTSIIGNIKRVNNAIESIESTFDQVKTIRLFGYKVESNGKLYFGKDCRLDMIYSKPSNKLISIKGKDFTVKNGFGSRHFDTDENVNMRMLRNTLLNSFAGNIESIAQETASKTEYEKTKESHVFKIMSTAEDKPYYSGFIISYDVNTLRMQKLTIVEASGNYTDYMLTGTARIKEVVI